MEKHRTGNGNMEKRRPSNGADEHPGTKRSAEKSECKSTITPKQQQFKQT